MFSNCPKLESVIGPAELAKSKTGLSPDILKTPTRAGLIDTLHEAQEAIGQQIGGPELSHEGPQI